MIQPHHVIQLSSSAQAADPPAVAVGSQHIPAVQGVAPQLTVGSEGIRGAPGYCCGIQLLIHLEQLRAAPGLHGVPGHVDGYIADDGDVILFGIGVQRVPLLKEQVLHKAEEADLLLQLIPGIPDGIGIPEFELLFPLVPGLAAEFILQGHEQGEVRQPVAVFGAESSVILVGGEPGVSSPENLEPVPVQQAEVRLVVGDVPGDARQVVLGEQALVHQGIQVDQVVVAREGGAGLVGGITVTGWGQRQDLPIALAGFFQKIHKFVGFPTHGADAVFPGQAGNMHQNAAGSHGEYLTFIYILQKFRIVSLPYNKDIIHLCPFVKIFLVTHGGLLPIQRVP